MWLLTLVPRLNAQEVSLNYLKPKKKQYLPQYNAYIKDVRKAELFLKKALDVPAFNNELLKLNQLIF